MGFDIAIYNGTTIDVDKISNSIKAAYLYADKVRVYDFVNTIFIGNESFEKKKKEKRKEYEELSSIIAHVPDQYRNDSYIMHAFREPSWKVLTELIEMRVVEQGISETRYLADVRSLTSKIESGEELDLNRLGIETVSFTYDLNDYSQINPIEACESQFISDKGFKVINDPGLDMRMRSNSTAMWVPAYLSEYSISSLPDFKEATLDEIIDIRKDLNKYIIPYRAAVLKMSNDIKDIPDTESIQQECMRIYLRDIEPQVVSINNAIHDNNIFKNIAKNVMTDEKTWAGVGALITAFATGGQLAEAICVGTALAFGATSVSKGISAALEESKKIKANEMFFLYEAGKRMKKGKTMQ